MTERLLIEKETIYMSLDTGEVAETQNEAMELYREGQRMQVMYRNRWDGGEWTAWHNGPVWEH